MRLTHRLILIFGLAIIISGCGSPSSVPSPTESVYYPSQAVLPPTITARASLTPIISPTPIATLGQAKAEEKISSLLMNSTDCSAPCFWGIVPGRTTAAEAKDFFNYIGLETNTITYKGQEFYDIDAEMKSGLSIGMSLAIQEGIVGTIRVYLTPSSTNDGYFQGVTGYSPATLINRYGSPSRVDFVADWGPGSFLAMRIFFQDNDMIVQYSGQDIIPRDKGQFQLCPLQTHYDSIDLWMGKNPLNVPRNGISLEDATNMTMEEFVKIVTGGSEDTCFMVDGTIF